MFDAGKQNTGHIESEWFDYLLVSKDEMREILCGTGWKITGFVDSEGPLYIALIEKE